MAVYWDVVVVHGSAAMVVFITIIIIVVAAVVVVVVIVVVSSVGVLSFPLCFQAGELKVAAQPFHNLDVSARTCLDQRLVALH